MSRHNNLPILTGCLVAVLAACDSTASITMLPDTWGSNNASLMIGAQTTMVKFLASGGCYGSYGVFDHNIPFGSFSFVGTYTQLTGAYPGHVDFPAEFTGTVDTQSMTLSVSIPLTGQVLGPYHFTAGVNNSWPQCFYP